MEQNDTVLLRGSTPELRFRFDRVAVSDLAEAILTLRQDDLTLEKDLTDAETDGQTLIWRLTQQETLRLAPDRFAELQCRFRLSDGTAGGSRIFTVLGGRILKDGVI